MKTMFFFLAKGCRKPRSRGLATATGSILKIHDYRGYVKQYGGKFFIIDCESADHGRRIIEDWRNGKFAPGASWWEYDEGRIVCIGGRACLAFRKSEYGIEQWERRIATQGKVTSDQSRALL